MEQEVSRTSWVWTAAAGITALGLVVVGLNGDPARSQEPGKTARTKSAEPTASAPAKSSRSERADPSFDRYRSLLRRNPFAPKLPMPAVEVTPVAPTPPVLPPPGAPPAEKPREEVKKPDAAAPPAPPAPVDPLKDWTYTGTVVIGEEVYAVLENKPNKRGEYVKTGGSFEGWTVELIAQSELRLSQGGGIRALGKSSAFNATPLNAPAGGPGGSSPGGQGGPGGPQGPGGPGGQGANPGGGPMPAGARPAGARPAAPTPGGAAAPSPAPAVAAPAEAVRVIK